MNGIKALSFAICLWCHGTVSAEREGPCVDLPEGAVLPHDDDCRGWSMCSNGAAIVMPACGTGLVFSRSESTCVREGELYDDCTQTVEYILEADTIANLLMLSNTLVPPPGEDGTVTVKHTMNVIRIVDLDVERQVLTTDAWLQMSWRDERLAEAFQNTDPSIEIVSVPNSKVWKPDIILFNNAATSQDYSADVLVVVARDGTVFFIPPARVMTYCKAPRDVTTDDIVTCDLTFGSWTSDAGRINMTTSAEYDLESSEFDNTFNHDWEVTSFVSLRDEKTYDSYPELYVNLKYSLTLRRK